MAEYQDPTQSADSVRIDSWSAAVGRERHWYNPLSWGNSTYIIQKLSFNRYEDDEVPSQAKRREQKQPVGPTRELSKDGKCWTEAEVETSTFVTRHFIKKRWVEYWRVNETLEAYYAIVNDVGDNASELAGSAAKALQESGRAAGSEAGSSGSGPSPGKVAGALAVTATALAPVVAGDAAALTEDLIIGAASGGGTLTEAGAVVASQVSAAATTTAAAGRAVTTVAGEVAIPAIAISATLVGSWVGTTKIMERIVKAAEKISEGWELVGPFDKPETLERSVIGWEPVGPVRDCPDQQPAASVEHWTTPQPTAPPRSPIRTWWWLGGLLILAGLLIGAVIIGGHQGGGASGASAPAPASSNPASSPLESVSSAPPVVIKDNKLVDNVGSPCTEPTTMHASWLVTGAPAGSAVVVTMTGPGLPPSDMFTIGTDGSFGKDYAVPAGAGVWTTKVVTIGGSPAPAANSSNRSTATCN